MKRLEVIVGKEDIKKLEKLFSSLDLLYSKYKSEVNGEACVSYSAIIPDAMVDELIKQISESIDLRRKENMITVYDTVATISPYLDRLREKIVKTTKQVNPLEAIIQPLNKCLCFDRNLAIMVSLATTIVLVGLFLNNVVIIIGAMLLAPLLGPINAASVNANLGKVKQLVQAEYSIARLVAISILIACVITVVTSTFVPLSLTEQILIRSDVTVVDIAVAILIGIAGGLALISNFPESLVGVAVAAALLPPATVTGIGLAYLRADLYAGALILTLSNLFGLQAGGILILRLKGITPRRYYEKAKARTHGFYSLLLFAIIIAALIGLTLVFHL
jgi:uncharacterized hydrophobic protein (TIGR00341 family)